MNYAAICNETKQAGKRREAAPRMCCLRQN